MKIKNKLTHQQHREIREIKRIFAIINNFIDKEYKEKYKENVASMMDDFYECAESFHKTNQGKHFDNLQIEVIKFAQTYLNNIN